MSTDRSGPIFDPREFQAWLRQNKDKFEPRESTEKLTKNQKKRARQKNQVRQRTYKHK